MYLHSILSVVLAVLIVLLLFVAVHFNTLEVFLLSPLKFTVEENVNVELLMFVESMYQVMLGAGVALLFTSQRTTWFNFSLIISGLSLGIKDTLWTSTVNQDNTCSV